MQLHRTSRIHCRGTSAIELLMVMPLIALMLVAMVGITQLMRLKQESVHFARYAAFAHAISGSQTPGGASTAAMGGADTWQLGANTGNFQQAFLQGGGGGGLGGSVASALASAAPFKHVEYRPSGTLGTPIWSSEFQGLNAQARYTLPIDFWTSDECSVAISMMRQLFPFPY